MVISVPTQFHPLQLSYSEVQNFLTKQIMEWQQKGGGLVYFCIYLLLQQVPLVRSPRSLNQPGFGELPLPNRECHRYLFEVRDRFTLATFPPFSNVCRKKLLECMSISDQSELQTCICSRSLCTQPPPHTSVHWPNQNGATTCISVFLTNIMIPKDTWDFG